MKFVQAGVMLLGSACYLGVAAFVFTEGFLGLDTNTALFSAVGGWIAILLVVTALVIVDSVRKARAGRTRDLATDLFVVKFAAVPFFLVNFAVLTSIAVLGTGLVSLNALFAEANHVIDFAGFVLVGAAITIGLSYVVMLTTSTYGWATVAQLRRDGRIGAGLAVLYRLMLVMFVLDVVAAILLYVHSRRGQAAASAAEPALRHVRLLQAGTMVLGLVVYALAAAVFVLNPPDRPSWILFIIGGWNTLLVAVAALVAADSVTKVRGGATRKLATDALVVKLAGLPFFLVSSFVLSLVTAGGLVIFVLGGALLVLAATVGAIFTYLAMLSTSVYSWAAISRLRRDGFIGTGLAVLYMLMSFVPVADIAAGVLVYGHSRRRPGRALVVVLLALGAILMDWGFEAWRLPPVVWFVEPVVAQGVGIAGIVLILATLAGSIIRPIVVRRRTRQLDEEATASSAELTEAAAESGREDAFAPDDAAEEVTSTKG